MENKQVSVYIFVLITSQFHSNLEKLSAHWGNCFNAYGWGKKYSIKTDNLLDLNEEFACIKIHIYLNLK